MRLLHHSGGVADAQPPATGFYPCQDTDSPTSTTARRIRRLAMRNRCQFGIEQGSLYHASKAKATGALLC